MPEQTYEPVIGLEIHVQLKTQTKMFCASPTAYGGPPNTQVCPVCLGLPGALPTVNGRAVELGVKAALGLGATVHGTSVFARKSYFYPDLPKGYQITQHDRPLATDGAVDVPSAGGTARHVRIRRLHLEEDSGKSLHDRVEGATAIDLNRAGTPLLEIVTEPDLASPADARAFLTQLKQALAYLDVSDCNMEEGSLRVDANVSLRRPGGGEGGTRTEIKNLNTFSGIEKALAFEVERQSRVLAGGGEVRPATLLWDAARGEAREIRGKEDGGDYRYFPEPDLPPLVLEDSWIDGVRRSLPEMPAKRVARFVEEYGITPGHAAVLTGTRDLADYYEAVARCGVSCQEAANWVMGEVLAAINAQSCALPQFRVRPRDLADLIAMMDEGILSRPAARQVFARMAETGEPPAQIVGEAGLGRVADAAAVSAWVDEALAAYPAEAERLRAGDAKLSAFFVGRVMNLSGGVADPAQVNSALKEKLGG
jgi:aspartyl-tRNA(Asn)/glutamyl-tRNA(Gln) amidotransferase subunit B